jgi:hypothetical protein
MNYALYASLAGNLLLVIFGMVMAAKLATAREIIDDRNEDCAELKRERGKLKSAFDEVAEDNAFLRAEVTEHRAKAEQRRISAYRASLASAAKRKSGVVLGVQ